MKSLILSLFILVSVSAATSEASTKTQSTKTKKSKTAVSKVAAKTKDSSLTTDAKFGDQAVGGKYQMPMEALSVVENEKAIDDLIGVRQNFQDRVERTKGMR